MAKVHEYDGSHLVVRYEKKLCIHAAECVRGLPQVFDPRARPWVKPDQATLDEVEAVVQRCPTGALTAERVDGSEAPLPEPCPNQVEVRPNGPLYLRGTLEIQGADEGASVTGDRLALCRCGSSENKPFCDGTHTKAGFSDHGVCVERPVREEVADASGVLEVSVVDDGPLIAKGPVEVRAPGKDRLYAGNRVALCRCGASREKPYCDGSHSEIGFKAR